MENREIKKEKWVYILPDGSKEFNMKDAKIKLRVSKTRLIGMLKSGLVKKVKYINPKSLKGYEHQKRVTEFSWC